MTMDKKDEKEPRDENDLTFNKETLEDLDAASDEAKKIKGGETGWDECEGPTM